MFRTSRTAAAVTAFAGIGLLSAAVANAQWGYPPSATYLHAPDAGAYGAAWRGSFYAPTNDYAAQYGYAVPAYGSASYCPPTYGYGSGYGYVDPGYRWHRGRTRHGIYTPYAGPEEIEYKFRRDGSVRIDVDD